MGEPKPPSRRTIGPFRAFEAYGTPICPQDTILRTKGILTKVIVLRFDGQSRSGCGRTCGGFAMLPPSLKPAPLLLQILRQLPTLTCTHRGAPKRGPPP